MPKLALKCTKIVSTIGPAITLKLKTDSPRVKSNPDYLEVLNLFDNLFCKGLNCVRFNFSHSNNEERAFRLSLLRETIVEFHSRFNRINERGESPQKLHFVFPFAEMCDTKGPEIRVWNFANTEQAQLYKRGQVVKVYCREKKLGDSSGFSVTDVTGTYNMALDCTPGEKILVDDGKLSLLIQNVQVEEGIVEAMIENDHILKSNKRVNLPNADYSLPFLSEKDKNDILFSVREGFDCIALSFVNRVEDIREVKQLIEAEVGKGRKPLILSKVETSLCLKNIDSIIAESDGIMIARGDLALESPYYDVPYWTREILRKSAKVGKPVIVATQMLDSLERSVVPTRAEVSDVYRAAELATDCTMLSGETAQGAFPLIAVSTMGEILRASEGRSNYDKFYSLFLRECRSQRVLEIASRLHQRKENFGDILACFLWETELSPEEVDALPRMRFPFPLIVFSKKGSYREAIASYESRRSALSRGLYRISVLNMSGESLEECARTFLELCGYTSGEKEMKLIALFQSMTMKVVPF
ncbi:pyruvate kinase [Candidatus Mycoplasma haematominutum]|uniref:Pyruvate kinase n=1 Tax=Candidatus Mycoplasma haematominutum 'Birmingham 1' TaxID=1116213 RepID=G8C3L1_9MOLU|nr:pyruvate kinase [Candidatus Mycoplasma haematominutum]CCE66909.1 pyruvate kinase [Candidatus Mycoplasma haematominutum 'Birmingham 1']